MAKVRVVGQATLKCNFIVDLPISEEHFESLSDKEQDEMLDTYISWPSVLSDAEVDEFDIDEYRRLEG